MTQEDPNKKFKQIWKLAVPYLKQGKMKNFVIHTKGVLLAMTMLLKKEKGDNNILIPAAILHDTGFSRVPVDLQKSGIKEEKKEALELHLKYAPEIIDQILTKVGYSKGDIDKVINVVVAHKFQDPKESDKRLLIDADTLSDTFKEQFYSDIKSYKRTPQELYEYRKQNKFYTKTAQKIFENELDQRKQEIF